MWAPMMLIIKINTVVITLRNYFSLFIENDFYIDRKVDCQKPAFPFIFSVCQPVLNED